MLQHRGGAMSAGDTHTPKLVRSMLLAGLLGGAAAAAAAIAAKIAWPYHVPLDLALIFGVPAGFLAGIVNALLAWALRARGRDAYHRLLDFATWLGVITFIGGLLWMFAGAGIYGSPLGGLSAPWDRPGAKWAFWILLVVICGPLALLPCALLERGWPRAGAIAMAAGAILAAEAGIRASDAAAGFSDDALIVIGSISVPLLVLAGGLLALRIDRHSVRGMLLLVAMCAVIIVGLRLRYVGVYLLFRPAYLPDES